MNEEYLYFGVDFNNAGFQWVEFLVLALRWFELLKVSIFVTGDDRKTKENKLTNRKCLCLTLFTVILGLKNWSI